MGVMRRMKRKRLRGCADERMRGWTMVGSGRRKDEGGVAGKGLGG